MARHAAKLNPSLWVTCHGCGGRWSHPGLAHCSQCHRSFAEQALFDLHRSEESTCRLPGTLRNGLHEPLLYLRDGLWRWFPHLTPGETTLGTESEE